MIRRRLVRVARAIAAPPRALWAWQAGIPDEGRVVLVGLGLVSAGFLFTPWQPIAAIAPGVVLTLAGLGWRPVRSRTS